MMPPFNLVIELSESIKDSVAKKYGEPPYGHAELSTLKTFTSKMSFDLAQSMERLKKADIKFESEKQTLQEIAKLNKESPQQLYLAMKPLEVPGKSKELPDTPQPGMGNPSLADLCQEYDLNIRVALRGLAENKIKAIADMTIKNIAVQNNISTLDVYAIIKETAKQHQ